MLSGLCEYKALVNAYKCEITEKSHFLVVNGYKTLNRIFIIMLNQYNLLIVLQIVGVVVIIAEIILPSGGILSIVSVAVLSYSLFEAYGISQNTGLLFTGLDIIIIPILIIFGLKLVAKSPATLSNILSKEIGVTSQNQDLDKFLGVVGIAITDLRPAGIITVDNYRLDVVTDGAYIEKGIKVIVKSVTGNQIIVTDRM